MRYLPLVSGAVGLAVGAVSVGMVMWQHNVPAQNIEAVSARSTAQTMSTSSAQLSDAKLEELLTLVSLLQQDVSQLKQVSSTAGLNTGIDEEQVGSDLADSELPSGYQVVTDPEIDFQASLLHLTPVEQATKQYQRWVEQGGNQEAILANKELDAMYSDGVATDG